MGNTALAIKSDKLPAHLKGGSQGRGNENVGDALNRPRIKLLQTMSAECDKYNTKYVEGVEPGDYYNEGAAQSYGKDLYVINLKFGVMYSVWRDFDIGGGYGGQYSSLAEANKEIASKDNPSEWESQETHVHVLLIKDPETGKLDRVPATMDYAVSKLRPSREWNSAIQRLNNNTEGGCDRFAHLWKLSSTATTSKQGKTFMNITTECAGWATAEDYTIAEEVYEAYTGANAANDSGVVLKDGDVPF